MDNTTFLGNMNNHFSFVNAKIGEYTTWFKNIMDKEQMDSQEIQTDDQATPEVAASCSKYAKDDNATFLANMKGRFNELVNTSMDEHKTCFMNTIDKIFGGLKAVEEKKVDAKEVAPLQAADST